jgi:hypothetical protein
MRFSEFGISEARQRAVIQPSVVKKQQRVGKVVAQIAASDAKQQQPSEMDKVMAMRQYANWQKQTDKAYTQRLKQQLVKAVGI